MSGSETRELPQAAGSALLPQSREQFDLCFPSEQACQDYVLRLRWAEGFRCPVCGSASCWRTSRGQFRCRQCQHQCSVTSGTLFDGTRKPLRDWLRAIWYVASRRSGVSALGLMRELDLHSYQTAWVWLHRLRQIMVRDAVRLGGHVEADRVILGGPEDRSFAARWLAPLTVAIAVEVDGPLIGRLRLRQIPHPSVVDWLAFLKDAVEPDAILQTRSSEDSASAGGESDRRQTAHVTYVATMLKRWMRGTYCGAIDCRYFGYYLDEFTFRANHRKTASRAQLFHILLLQAIRSSPEGRLRPAGARPRIAPVPGTDAAILRDPGMPDEHRVEEYEDTVVAVP